jgi:hypothetical protein
MPQGLAAPGTDLDRPRTHGSTVPAANTPWAALGLAAMGTDQLSGLNLGAATATLFQTTASSRANWIASLAKVLILIESLGGQSTVIQNWPNLCTDRVP